MQIRFLNSDPPALQAPVFRRPGFLQFRQRLPGVLCFDLDGVTQLCLWFAGRAKQTVPEAVQRGPLGSRFDVEGISASITDWMCVDKQGAVVKGLVNSTK